MKCKEPIKKSSSSLRYLPSAVSRLSPVVPVMSNVVVLVKSALCAVMVTVASSIFTRSVLPPS